MATFHVHPTPNPNSLKITLAAGSFAVEGMASFNSPTEAAGHPLAAALFALPGIANVFLLPQFMTITKHPEADWDALLPPLEALLQAG